jgi:hypothetical protein
MIKLHVFHQAGREYGYLYDDAGEFEELCAAAEQCGLSREKYQEGKLIHFDLWGKPLKKAKELFRIVDNHEIAADMEEDNNYYIC